MKQSQVRCGLSLLLIFAAFLNLTPLPTSAQQRRPRRTSDGASESLPVGSRVLPRGYVLILRMESPLNSDTARPSDRFVARIDEAITDEAGSMILPANLIVIGHVARVEPAQMGRRSGVIEVDFDRLVMPDGRELPLKAMLTSADPAERKKLKIDEEGVIEGGSQIKRNTVFIGGGAAAGAVVGAIAGGAALGAGIGAAVGVAAVLLAKGKEAVVNSGTLIGIELIESLDLSQRGVIPPPRPSTSTQPPVSTTPSNSPTTPPNTLPNGNTPQQPVPTPVPILEPQLTKVSFVQAQRVAGGTILIIVTAETPSSGWRIKPEHTVNQDVLEVWVKALPPEGRAAKVIAHPTGKLEVADPSRFIRRILVHGTNGDRTVVLPAQSGR
ncbi:MAG: hypothetical protein JST84_11760 [Acidobacteria bacterium]|nr:hypothetical protein [Acidobacteriota bacterium]